MRYKTIGDELDWLARNMVGEVPDDATYVYRIAGDVLFVKSNITPQPTGTYTIEAIRKRQNELRNKPSWDDAPDWATCLVQCDEGLWYWCSVDQQSNDAGGWGDIGEDGEYVTSNQGEVIGDWRDTKEFRPQPQLPSIGTRLVNQFDEVRTVIAHDGVNIVCRCEEKPGSYRGYTPDEQKTLKPEPSEEDLAVEAMKKIIGPCTDVDKASVALYRAGYRLVEGGE